MFRHLIAMCSREAALPPVLKPPGSRSLAVARVMRHARSTFGPYIGVYLGAPALFEDRPVFHLFSGLKTDFSGTVAGREVWGMPLQQGDVEMGWHGDVLTVTAGRGIDFVRMSVRLEHRVEPPEINRLRARDVRNSPSRVREGVHRPRPHRTEGRHRLE